jgi:hypothetical protein
MGGWVENVHGDYELGNDLYIVIEGVSACSEKDKFLLEARYD